MNVPTTVKSNKKSTEVVKITVTTENHYENISNSVSTFNQLLANISNKLGLSKAIYQK
ncbi:MAG: hypothetical protein HRT55_10225 [Colwellia sp.]|uniref:hypothetical protein n=1 Tax=Colwellia sp. TaxID=56799 RepID=UPI0025C19A61|nr:hypothetical protein [Colwellia sp.]MCJ8296424.1 hypothetical protein [Colwellia sp.]NQZ26680.1 hypothetical protein [Colwellia sp.]